MAKDGDVAAARELFDRVFGKSPVAMSLNVTDAERPRSPIATAVMNDPEAARQIAAIYRRFAASQQGDASATDDSAGN